MASSWERLASVTLSSTGDTLSTGTFTAKEHLRVNFITMPSGNANPKVRFNNDSGGNYARRRQEDFGSESTSASDSEVDYGRGGGDVVYASLDIINIANKEKLVESQSSVSNGDGAGNVPKSGEIIWKWVNTSDQVTRIDVINTADGDFAVGSTITVWGADDQGSTTTDHSKASITDVPDGTRYEETDTRKIFHKRTQTGSGGGDIWVEKGNAFSASALRGFASGGSITGASSNVIDYVTISTLGNAADFGDLTNARQSGGSCADATRCVEGASASIDYWTAATLGNATDFGDLTASRTFQNGAFADSTRGIFAGGNNVIDYITIQSAGNATDFGDLQGSYEQTSGCADATRGLICGGWTGAYVNSIDYITIQTTGNAADFGDMTVGRYALASTSDATRGCTSGGHSGSLSNVIDYVTIQTTGNATDFGDLYVAIHKHTAYADATRGCIGVGGANGGRRNVIQYITIQTTGNSADFGDITEDKEVTAGCAA